VGNPIQGIRAGIPKNSETARSRDQDGNAHGDQQPSRHGEGGGISLNGDPQRNSPYIASATPLVGALRLPLSWIPIAREGESYLHNEQFSEDNILNNNDNSLEHNHEPEQ
jgi:hypothetical protein